MVEQAIEQRRGEDGIVVEDGDGFFLFFSAKQKNESSLSLFSRRHTENTYFAAAPSKEASPSVIRHRLRSLDAGIDGVGERRAA